MVDNMDVNLNDIDVIRRDNLLSIESEVGGAAEIARLIGMSASQYLNLRNGAKDSKTGKRRGMRKETARRIEKATGKSLGWLDIEHSGNPRHPELPPPDSSALAIALEVLSRSLVAADDLTLDQVRPLLIRLVDEPYRAQEISPRLISLLIAR